MRMMMPPLLVCCEGKTEQKYFQILQRIYRLPGARISIVGEKGQHMALIERTVEEREQFCAKQGFRPDEVECWAVCDDDNMPWSYKELLEYAEKNNVHLAFSRPQFEAYLLQHFEQSGESHQKVLYEKLGAYKTGFDGAGYDENTKGDLEWLREAIDQKPKIVDTAIINSNQRKKQSGKVFLTVQALVEWMRKYRR